MQLLDLNIHPDQYHQLSAIADKDHIAITKIRPNASTINQQHVEQMLSQMAEMLQSSYRETDNAIARTNDVVEKGWQGFIENLKFSS